MPIVTFDPELAAQRRKEEQIGIDAPYIFINPTNKSRPANFSFGTDLMESILQAMMPVNSTAKPSLSGIATSAQQLPPDVLINNLLVAMIPVLASASANDLNIASAHVKNLLVSHGMEEPN